MPLLGFTSTDPCMAAQVLPGTGILEYVPLDALTPGIYEPALTNGYNQNKEIGVTTWLKMPYLHGSGQWSEDQSRADQGHTFQINITFTLSGDSLPMRAELERMKGRRFLIRLTRNGQVNLIGTPEQSLQFESKFDSGAQGGDQRAHRCSFRGTLIKKSPGYVPTF